MSRIDHQDIRIGTMAGYDNGPDYIRQILEHGFESFEITFSPHFEGASGLKEGAKRILEACEGEAVINAIGVYGNPLQDERCIPTWELLIKNAKEFGATVVCGFAGAQEDRPVDENIPQFKKVFTPLAKLAADHGVKIAFENCDMGGDWRHPRWNIAHAPAAWDLIFDAVAGDTIGLEWEPCHQMVSLIEPIAQLRKYVSRVYHLHGKDATVCWDVIESAGIRGGKEYIYHRTPGFGDSNWTDIITILRQGGFKGSIDIEGWHDPIYRDELEMTGQVYGLNYLKACRGGDYVPNPVTK